MATKGSARKDAIEYLSQSTGVEEERIAKVAAKPNYRRMEIPKSRDHRLMRVLNIPQSDHRLVQDQLKSFLGRLPVSSVAHAYIKGRSVHTNVRPHYGSDSFWSLDFQDAYPTIDRSMVERALTRGFEEAGVPNKIKPQELAKLIAELTVTKRDGLPQGAPCSPSLINIVCYQLDRDLMEIADAWGLTFTRYSDDLMFSSSDPISTLQRDWIKEIISRYGFKVSPDKENYKRGKATEPVINGITLVGNHRQGLEIRTPGLSKQKINSYRSLIHKAVTDESIPVARIEGVVEWVIQVYQGQFPGRLREPLRRFVSARAPQLATHYDKYLSN